MDELKLSLWTYISEEDSTLSELAKLLDSHVTQLEPDHIPLYQIVFEHMLSRALSPQEILRPGDAVVPRTHLKKRELKEQALH